LEEFRQHLGGRLTLTMLRNVGDPIDVHEVNRESMCEAIEIVAKYAAAPQQFAQFATLR
jgi:3-dehydroquinate synthase